ncbi:hypothetical protein [Plesiomonas shigelloides]|nr:hypothetical protein [Plesiomonas shigelloides]KAB7664654.1 hypothetical protein GBN25_08425 [Plesiomonas shigelloides]
MLNAIARFNIYFFSISSILFPVSIANKIFFIFAFVTLVLNFFSGTRFPRLYSPIIIISIYAVGFASSFATDSNIDLSIQFFMSTLILLLVYYIYIYNVDFEKILFSCLIILACFTLFISMLHSFNLLPEYMKYFFEKYSLGSIGSRELAGILVPMIHFGTVPILFLGVVISCGYMLKRGLNFRNLLVLIVFLIVIVLSSSRALILLSFLYIFFMLYIRSGFLFKLALVCFISIVIYINFKFIYMNLSSDDFSNSVKIGHVLGFFDYFSWHNLVLGNGLASYYYSPGVSKLVAHTEITPLDQIRYFGLIPVIIIYGSLILPGIVLVLNENDTHIKMKFLGFVMYLLMSLTNPVLFNSFGILVILWWWSVLLKVRGYYNNA